MKVSHYVLLWLARRCGHKGHLEGCCVCVCVCVCLITRIICLIKNNKLSGKMNMFSFALWVNFNFLNFSKINCAKCSCKCKTNFHLFVRRTPSPRHSSLSLYLSLSLCAAFLCSLSLSLSPLAL